MSKIWGVGTDIVQISRIRKTYERFGMRFLKRAYNPIEIAKFQSKSINQFNYLAARWAVKEAVYKAIGEKRILFPEITVKHTITHQPSILFSGNALSIVKNLGIDVNNTHLSISDDGDFAVAFVILEII